MDESVDNQGGQLPPAQAGQLPGVAAPNVPTAALSLAAAPNQDNGIVQQALAVLMDTRLSPYQMSVHFAALKEEYLAKTYGVIIE